MATVNSIAIDLMIEHGDQTDDADLVLVNEKRVNDAMDKIAAQTGWNLFKARDTFNTAAGTAVYNMIAGLREIIQLRYTDNGEPITLMSIQEAARRGIRLEEPGRAKVWLEDGHIQSGADNLYRIRLAPVPASILQIEREYYFNPAETASASHIPVQDNIIAAIKDHVRAALAVSDQMYDEAAFHRTSFAQILDRLLKQERGKVAKKIVLQDVDLANIRRFRGPRLPSNFPDYG